MDDYQRVGGNVAPGKLIKNMKSEKTVKSIDWAYPSSENAARFGFAKVGCWTVSLTTFSSYDDSSPQKVWTRAVSGHADQGDAYDAAKALPNDWASWVPMADAHARLCREMDASTPYTV